MDQQRATTSSASLPHTLDEWMRTTELEDSTRKTYEDYIARTIKPAFGDLSVRKLDARMMESFCTQLRRCRTRCDGTPYVEKHGTDENGHDCKAAGCKLHKCRPMAASTVRQIHAILSGALGAAERWD